MRTVALIQARMGSTRLPGKSIFTLYDWPLLGHVLERVSDSRLIEDLAVIAPKKDWRELGPAIGIFNVLWFEGAEDDLIGRYSWGAKYYKADIVVRIPADNPCIDPDEIDRIIAAYNEDPPKWNYLTSNLDRNIHGNGYPGGLGAEVYDARFLHWMNASVTDPRYREHPHLWAFANQKVKTIQAPEEIRRPWLDFSVNTQADFDEINGIYEALYPTNPNFRTRDILDYLEGDYGKGQTPERKETEERL